MDGKLYVFSVKTSSVSLGGAIRTTTGTRLSLSKSGGLRVHDGRALVAFFRPTEWSWAHVDVYPKVEHQDAERSNR